MANPKFGVIVGNRGFFPDHLAASGRKEMIRILESEGIDAVILDESERKSGSVESLEDSQKCGRLLKAHADEIIGIIVTLPNFGDERAVANAIRFSGLNVPVLVQAFADEADKMTVENRRDSFCGKMSVCNNLKQYGIPFTLTTRHTVNPDTDSFRQDLRDFLATCRVVKGLRGARIGALGARPANFTTVRYSEKLLEKAQISIETLDLSEALGRAQKLGPDSPDVKMKMMQLQAYVRIKGIPTAALAKMAAFGVVVDHWVSENDLDATAIQCWTAMEEYFGVVPCTMMSIMSDALKPSACEVDVTGAIGMLALQHASGRASALVDWNNNYGEDPDKAVLFHCSNLPSQIFAEIPRMDYQAIIAGTVGMENTFGTVVGRIKSEPFTFCRVATDDDASQIRAYVGEGIFTDDPLETFGGYGVVRIPNMQTLLQHICENGYEHHTAVNIARTAKPIAEAMAKYLGWSVYTHQ